MSIPDDDHHANTVLAQQMPPEVVPEIEAVEARGQDEGPRDVDLLVPHGHDAHICRLTDGPDPVNRSHGARSVVF